MEKFTKITGKVIPLDMNNVDTDMIIPAQYLTNISFAGYGEHIFERLRAESKDFVFNKQKYRNSKILISGENFGCGSSREHAVWAILQSGIKVVIAKSFSDIFYNNSAKNGLLLIALDSTAITSLMQQAQNDLELTVDLEKHCILTNQGEEFTFAYDLFHKECFLKGQDDLDYLLEVVAKHE